MSVTAIFSEPGSFSLRHLLLRRRLTLGVPLTIWIWAVLLIAIAAHFDPPVIAFDGQELVVPF
jgi:hypothetical protein